MSADAGAVGPVPAPFGGNARLVRQTGVVLFGLPVNYGQYVYLGGGNALYRVTTCLIPFVDPGNTTSAAAGRRNRGGLSDENARRKRPFRRRTRELHALCTSGTHHTDASTQQTIKGRWGVRIMPLKRVRSGRASVGTHKYIRSVSRTGLHRKNGEIDRCLDSIFTLSLVEQ